MKMSYMMGLFILSLLLSQINSRCGVGFLNKPKRVLVEQNRETVRGLTQQSWDSIRIQLDYSRINNNPKIDAADIKALKEKIMPKTVEVLQKLLKVNESRTNFSYLREIVIHSLFQTLM